MDNRSIETDDELMMKLFQLCNHRSYGFRRRRNDQVRSYFLNALRGIMKNMQLIENSVHPYASLMAEQSFHYC